MKKIVSMILAVFCLLTPQFAYGQAAKTYQVPVVMKHASVDKESMANKALSPLAEVKEEGGKMTYTIFVKPLSFMNQQGQLTNLFVEGTSPREAVKGMGKGDYTSSFSFVRNNLKESSLDVAVWVDVMDQMQGGTPGAGEQKARLAFDWSGAKLVKTAEEAKADGKKGPAPKEISIVVNGKLIATDSPVFVEQGRTMVPLRFISEALGLKVDWDGKNSMALVGEGKDLMRLPIGKKVILKSDGSSVKIDVAAMARNGRTMVPIRAIGEISGAQVNWDGAKQQVVINK